MSSQSPEDQAAQGRLTPNEYQDRLEVYWRLSYETLYNVVFQEGVSSALVERWRRVDILTNILVAVTASGSAIAGWAVWNQAGGRVAWAILAGCVSVLSIVHGAVQVPTQLKEQDEFRRLFSRLRVDLETFRQELELEPGRIEAMSKTYIGLRDRYADLVMRAPSSIINTRKLRLRAQEETDRLLEEATDEDTTETRSS